LGAVHIWCQCDSGCRADEREGPGDAGDSETVVDAALGEGCA